MAEQNEWIADTRKVGVLGGKQFYILIRKDIAKAMKLDKQSIIEVRFRKTSLTIDDE